MAVRRSLLTLAALVALLASATPARAQSFISSGQLATLSATDCVIIRTQRLGAAAITLGGTWTGTVNFEVNARDTGATATCATGNGWVAKTFGTSTGGTPVASATATGTWDGSIGGYALLRVRFTRSSGSLDVTIGTGQGGGTSSGSGGGGLFDGVLRTPNADSAMDETNDAARVNVVAGGTSGPTDTDDGSIAGAQTPGLSAALGQAWDGTVWRRVTFGTAGTASAQVTTVQGIASMTPLAVSQSGTWTVQPGNTANSTAWLVTGTGGTFPATQSGTWNVTNISGTVSLPTGAATAANQTTLNGLVDGLEAGVGTGADAAVAAGAAGSTTQQLRRVTTQLDQVEIAVEALSALIASSHFNVNVGRIAGSTPVSALCDNPTLLSTVSFELSAATGSVEVVPDSGAEVVTVCGFTVSVGAASVTRITTGTGTNCGTGTVDLAVYRFPADGDGTDQSNTGVAKFQQSAAGGSICIERDSSVTAVGSFTVVQQ